MGRVIESSVCPSKDCVTLSLVQGTQVWGGPEAASHTLGGVGMVSLTLPVFLECGSTPSTPCAPKAERRK